MKFHAAISTPISRPVPRMHWVIRLVNMRNQLRVARLNDNQRNWAAEGLAQISELMRSSKSLEELCHDIVKFVVTYTKSNQGGLFLIHEDDDTKVLNLAACYAYEKKKIPRENYWH